MYKIPKWIKSVPKSTGHGSGDLQQRLWRVVTDYCRIRDWYQYNGRCVATGEYIPEWKLGQGGHFIHYSRSNGMFKFDIWNVHLQSAMSNKLSQAKDGYYYGEELKRRYGDEFIEELKEENRKHTGEKVENWMVVKEIEDILDLMSTLQEQPDYYERVIKLRNEERN